MEKKEFKDFCHREFTQRGFKKCKSVYYSRSPHGILCGLSLQSAYGTGYYINCDFYIGEFNDPQIYPSQYDADLYDRPICVMSKVTYKGEYFMTPLIEYEKYSIEELLPFFSQAFENRILPPLRNGKHELLTHLDEWELPDPSVKSIESVLIKLKE